MKRQQSQSNPRLLSKTTKQLYKLLVCKVNFFVLFKETVFVSSYERGGAFIYALHADCLHFVIYRHHKFCLVSLWDGFPLNNPFEHNNKAEIYFIIFCRQPK
jgi:hypothetical protein